MNRDPDQLVVLIRELDNGGWDATAYGPDELSADAPDLDLLYSALNAAINRFFVPPSHRPIVMTWMFKVPGTGRPSIDRAGMPVSEPVPDE